MRMLEKRFLSTLFTKKIQHAHVFSCLGGEGGHEIVFWWYKILQKKMQNAVEVWYQNSKVTVLVKQTFFIPYNRFRLIRTKRVWKLLEIFRKQ